MLHFREAHPLVEVALKATSPTATRAKMPPKHIHIFGYIFPFVKGGGLKVRRVREHITKLLL